MKIILDKLIQKWNKKLQRIKNELENDPSKTGDMAVECRGYMKGQIDSIESNLKDLKIILEVFGEE